MTANSLCDKIKPFPFQLLQTAIVRLDNASKTSIASQTLGNADNLSNFVASVEFQALRFFRFGQCLRDCQQSYSGVQSESCTQGAEFRGDEIPTLRDRRKK